MDEEPIKICTKCGEEYSLEAMICAECGGALVFPKTHEERSAPLEEEEAKILIRQGSVNIIRELGELLEKNGIRSYIRFHGCEPGT